MKALLNLSVIAFNLITLMYILKEIKKAAKSDEVSEAYLRNACTEHLVSSIYSLSSPIFIILKDTWFNINDIRNRE